jgi:hypothetical protein
MNRVRKEQLREQIDKLEPEEHAQIFAIIKKHTESFTTTQTGVMVSSDTLNNECLLEMEKMVQFYRDQRKRMESDAIERKTIQRQ